MSDLRSSLTTSGETILEKTDRNAALFLFLKDHPIRGQHHVLHDHRAQQRTNQGQPPAKLGEQQESQHHISHQQRHHGNQGGDGTQLPGEKHGNHAEENNQGELQRERKCDE